MPIRANNVTEMLKMMQVLFRRLIFSSNSLMEWERKYSEVYNGLSPSFRRRKGRLFYFWARALISDLRLPGFLALRLYPFP